MTVTLQCFGAARTVTGSRHLLQRGATRVLLDCGLFQGHRKEAHEKNLRLPCPVDEIDAIILSHAHIDHAGRLPLLAKHGYRRTIWATASFTSTQGSFWVDGMSVSLVRPARSE